MASDCEPDRDVHLGRFVGSSAAMGDVYDLIAKGAPTNAPVLLVGELGTGKEIAAQTIHDLSKRRRSTLLSLDCGAIPPSLIEGQLFGHERGSLTGAARRRVGSFEQADGGTLFFDEITEMSIELHVKLLRVLEFSSVMRIGGNHPIEVDVRVIAATNRDPDEAILNGALRKDLYYRLNVYPIPLPPLRERERDTVLIAEHALADLNREYEMSKCFSGAALDALCHYDWPGNVRDLKNVIHRAFTLSASTVTEDDLPALVLHGTSARSSGSLAVAAGSGSVSNNAVRARDVVSLEVGCSIAEAQKQLILATLDFLDNDRKETARRLGISPRSLYNRLREYRDTSEAS